MSANDNLPFMPNREELKRLLAARIDPDAERFRYFGEAMLSAMNEGFTPSQQALTLQAVMERQQPATLEELRACIDAAMRLTP